MTSPASPSSVVPVHADDTVLGVLRSPRLLTREALAGIVTTLALVPEVISFSVIAGVDPMVSLVSSVVLAIVMSLLGGRPAMVTAAAGSVALVVAPLVQQHGRQHVLDAVGAHERRDHEGDRARCGGHHRGSAAEQRHHHGEHDRRDQADHRVDAGDDRERDHLGHEGEGGDDAGQRLPGEEARRAEHRAHAVVGTSGRDSAGLGGVDGHGVLRVVW